MVDSLINARLQIQEFGPPVPISRHDLNLQALAEANAYWSGILGLREEPLVVTYTSHGRLELRAKAVTGVIRVGNTEIEIVPKFLNPVDSRWQRVLWQILMGVYGGHTSEIVTSGDVDDSPAISDLLAEQFVASYQKGAVRGLPRLYRSVITSGPVLKGSLDLSRLGDVLRNPGEIPYISDELSHDTPLARLLRWAAATLVSTVTNPKLAHQLRDIGSNLADVGRYPPHVLDARTLTLGAQHQGLQAALFIGKLLLEGAGIHHAGGDHPLSGFLWDSDVIYENYVFNLCNRAVSHAGGTVTQSTAKFGYVISGTGSTLATRPDIVFRDRSSSPFAIADAKYKKIGLRPQASDTYQILTAGHVLGCSKVSLAYPVSEAREPLVWSVASELGGQEIELTALPMNLMELDRPGGQSRLMQTIIDWLQT